MPRCPWSSLVFGVPTLGGLADWDKIQKIQVEGSSNKKLLITKISVTAVWEELTDWTVCSASCGGGTRTRTKMWRNGDRSGTETHSLRCNLESCSGMAIEDDKRNL